MFQLKLENQNGNIIDVNDERNYIVVGVSGLNPPSATLWTSKSPNHKGSIYNGSTLNDRVLVVNIKLLGDVEANRNALYAWCDTEEYCKVHYRNGEKNVYCEGYVQDCPVEVFTENEIAAVAIVCPDPFWKALEAIQTDISSLLKQFIFPFAITSAGVPFSTIREDNTTNIYNDGAETGVTITINCKEEIKNLVIFNANDTTQQIRFNTVFPKGWIVEINTEGSPKTCRAIKTDGSVTNLMRYLGGVPTWFQLKKGHNLFGYTADSGVDTAEIAVSFTQKWKGV